MWSISASGNNEASGVYYYVPYTVNVYNYYSAEYYQSGSGQYIKYTIYKQNIGGVIKNANTYAYPFDQEIANAWVDYYKNGVKTKDIAFSIDNSPSIYDPADEPYSFINVQALYLYNYDYNELVPKIFWLSLDSTIPT